MPGAPWGMAWWKRVETNELGKTWNETQDLIRNIGFYHGKMWISSQKHRILSANMSNSTKNMGEVTLWDVANVMIPAANRLMWNLTMAYNGHMMPYV